MSSDAIPIFEDSDEETVTETVVPEPIHPYGANYEAITEKHLQEIAHQLSLINLCWPKEIDIIRQKYFPRTYSDHTEKEKLLLWYCENFRRQYHFVYPKRKPLLLAADNECNVQMIGDHFKDLWDPFPSSFIKYPVSLN